MKLSKRLRKWKANLMTQTPVEYVLTLRTDVNGFADEVKALERENDKLRELVADMMKMLVLACWASVESDEEASQCIYRAEAFGIEVDE